MKKFLICQLLQICNGSEVGSTDFRIEWTKFNLAFLHLEKSYFYYEKKLESEDFIMWITKKEFNEIIERKLYEQKREYDLEITSRDARISHLETELALKDLGCEILNMDIQLMKWSKYWETDESEVSDNGKIEG